MGLLPLESITGEVTNAIPVILDGIFIGYVLKEIASDFVEILRKYKIKNKQNVPQTISIAAVLDYQQKIWPEITLSTLPARMIRPVIQLQYNKIEWVTPMEQVNRFYIYRINLFLMTLCFFSSVELLNHKVIETNTLSIPSTDYDNLNDLSFYLSK